MTRGANASDGGTPLILAVEQSALMCSPEVFLAKMSQTQDCGLAWKGCDLASGLSLIDALASFVQGLWLSRTCEDSLLGESIPFSETFPTEGMTRNGRLYARPMLARRIDAPECSSSASDETWLTPNQTPDATSNNGSNEGRPSTVKSLAKQASGAWPTPQSYSKGKPENSAPGLTPLDITARPDLAHLKDWPTTIREDSESRTAHGTLTDAVRQIAPSDQWATPQARDARGITQGVSQGDFTDTLPDQIAGLHDLANPNTPGSPLAPSPWPVLNPRWVACLMGFPEDWLDGVALPSRRSGTPSSRRLPKLSRGASVASSTKKTSDEA